MSREDEDYDLVEDIMDAVKLCVSGQETEDACKEYLNEITQRELRKSYLKGYRRAMKVLLLRKERESVKK